MQGPEQARNPVGLSTPEGYAAAGITRQGSAPPALGDGGLRSPLDGARTNPILGAESSRGSRMRPGLRNRRLWAGLVLGGALAATILVVWKRGSHEGEASARISEPVTSTAAPTSARRLGSEAAPAESSPAPQPGFARFEDYFNRNYYATYSYTLPAHVPADWSRAAPASAPRPPPPQSSFTVPSIGDVLESAKLLPNVPLTMPGAALRDVSKLAPAATVSIPTPSPPAGLFTNTTPFHVFVTSDPVSAAASTVTDTASATSSSGSGGVGSAAGGAVGTVGSAAGAVTGTVGSLLRK